MAGEKENQRNSVEDNVGRAMTKAILDETLQILEERNEKAISREELIARLEKSSLNRRRKKLSGAWLTTCKEGKSKSASGMRAMFPVRAAPLFCEA